MQQARNKRDTGEIQVKAYSGQQGTRTRIIYVHCVRA